MTGTASDVDNARPDLLLGAELRSIFESSPVPLNKIARLAGVSQDRLEGFLDGSIIPVKGELPNLLNALGMSVSDDDFSYEGWEVARQISARYRSERKRGVDLGLNTTNILFLNAFNSALNGYLTWSPPGIPGTEEFRELLNDLAFSPRARRAWIMAHSIAESINEQQAHRRAQSQVRYETRSSTRDLPRYVISERARHEIDIEEVDRAHLLNTKADSSPVTIYLNDHDADRLAGASIEVERAVRAWLEAKGKEIIYEGRPVTGSWWKALVARAKNPTEEDIHKGAKLVARTASLYGLDTRQAEVDKMQAEAFAAVMKALEGVDQAVIHSGTLLVVKNGPLVIRRELSQLDVENLRLHPILTTRPATILQELEALAYQQAALELAERPPQPEQHLR
ncbi:hypothetical protein [Nonomuraea sediminis]|uniref:hypothetical protein n=1 Tax=Nonomuraea sediminis TaxID=2835864 RepID=UPI001BDDAD2A|nr:hypothetical protein [Nonomuraea sediminis]